MSKGTESSVRIRAGESEIRGELFLPEGTGAVVIFAHGSGSSRHSPRNRYVAKFLNGNGFGLGTLLIDLLTSEEEEIDAYEGAYRFNVSLLKDRLLAATDWVSKNPLTSNMEIGYFGASTGAAAALMAAPERPGLVRAIVSRGGRPDLAGELLSTVKTPTLLIVGERDTDVLKLNQKAFDQLQCREKKLEIITGATHLFEEPGTLENAAEAASNWLRGHLAFRRQDQAQAERRRRNPVLSLFADEEEL